MMGAPLDRRERDQIEAWIRANGSPPRTEAPGALGRSPLDELPDTSTRRGRFGFFPASRPRKAKRCAGSSP